MLFDKKLDVEHLYAGKKNLLCMWKLELRDQGAIIFFVVFPKFFLFGSKTEKISVCTKYAMFC